MQIHTEQVSIHTYFIASGQSTTQLWLQVSCKTSLVTIVIHLVEHCELRDVS